jgi:hypothetical protein
VWRSASRAGPVRDASVAGEHGFGPVSALCLLGGRVIRPFAMLVNEIRGLTSARNRVRVSAAVTQNACTAVFLQRLTTPLQSAVLDTAALQRWDSRTGLRLDELQS